MSEFEKASTGAKMDFARDMSYGDYLGLDAILALNRARNWDEFNRALDRHAPRLVDGAGEAGLRRSLALLREEAGPLEAHRMQRLAAGAARTGSPLPAAYDRLFRLWFLSGVPAFAGVLAILWLMLNKPVM